MPLLSLPLELFENIAEHLRPDDLLTIRYVSRKAAEMVNRTYISSHFSFRKVDLDQPGWKRLFQIAQHPDFGPALKSLELETTAAFQDPECSTPLNVDMHLGQVNEIGSDFDNLVLLFIMLKKNGTFKRLCVIQKYDFEDLDMAMQEPEDRKISYYDQVFEALLVSGLQVEDIEQYNSWLLPFRQRLPNQSLSAAWLSAGAKLRSLTLRALYVDDSADAHFELAKILPELPELRHLQLRNDDQCLLGNSMDGKMVTCVFQGNFPKLERLELHRQWVKLHELLAFVRCQANGRGLKTFEGYELSIMGMGADCDERSDEDLEKQFREEVANCGNVLVELDGSTSFEA